jgi:hypothetical protein
VIQLVLQRARTWTDPTSGNVVWELDPTFTPATKQYVGIDAISADLTPALVTELQSVWSQLSDIVAGINVKNGLV